MSGSALKSGCDILSKETDPNQFTDWTYSYWNSGKFKYPVYFTE